ncbi:MAG: hypothetical protein NTV60_03515 [Candidatus Kaiserbacteria bacterium]|nr:hypothetical protein [Candidatus Kaiserbacteria bacterium]
MSQHTQYAFRRGNWWDRRVYREITLNDVILVVIAIVLAIIYVFLNWDKIVGFW